MVYEAQCRGCGKRSESSAFKGRRSGRGIPDDMPAYLLNAPTCDEKGRVNDKICNMRTGYDAWKKAHANSSHHAIDHGSNENELCIDLSSSNNPSLSHSMHDNPSNRLNYCNNSHSTSQHHVNQQSHIQSPPITRSATIDSYHNLQFHLHRLPAQP
jgi:hypothetical protein